MRLLLLRSFACLSAALAAACGSSPETSNTTTSTATGGSGGSAPSISLALPQAIDGALWANRFTYANVPLHVQVTGEPASVRVTAGAKTVEAVKGTSAGDWVATVPIADLPDGITTLTIDASAPGASSAQITADLGVGDSGVQLTDFSKVGLGRSPYAHLDGGALSLTWIDRSETQAKLWIQRLDGAGRFQGDRVLLAASPAKEILYAQPAWGKGTIGILYKEPGVPYATFFKIADPTGKEISAPVALDPAGFNGSFGGDVVYDAANASYVAVWRVADGTGKSEVRWARFAEADGKMTGPTVIASAGAGDANDPVGGFDPFSFEKVRLQGDHSVVGYVRHHYSAPLDLTVPRAELAVVKADGTVSSTAILGGAESFTYARESRVYDIKGALISLHSRQDLNDPSTQIPMGFYAARLDAQGALTGGDSGTRMFKPIDDRDEPFLLPHPEAFGVMAWLDHRAYTEDPPNGRINLYVQKVGDDLRTTSDPTVFQHVWFTAGLSELNGVGAGTNMPLFWIDFRHSVGTDFRPEVYMETAWY